MNIEKNTNVKAYDIKIICYYTGFIVLVMGLLMIIPIITAIVYLEFNPLLDFIISCEITCITGTLLIKFGKKAKEAKSNLQWKHGLSIASLSWVLLTILCALPYWMSGHMKSFLDSCFDVMSGFTTTGVSLIQDMDHISNSLNMWRHLLTFIGGQGMVVLALTFFVRETNGAYKMYVGEGKDIELLPNVKETARQIWKISIVYLVIGTFALWIAGIVIGLDPKSALLHGFYMFESSWSTGGFAPYSQNIMYYHSLLYETITMVIFIIGSLNFGLHYAIWQGRRKEIFKNIEIQSFFVTSLLLCLLAVSQLNKMDVYSGITAGYRRILFNVLSAHTTTGLGSVYARQFALEWGDFGILIMIITMMIGGSACSTAGGLKGLRMGIVAKGLIMEIKKLLSSDNSVKVYKFHYMKTRILDDALIKSSAIIILCYILTLVLGSLLGTYYGYPLAESAFEAASITGNVGLSIGITSASMPEPMKIFYIFAMYLGRLEFLSVFALIGFLGGGIKKLCIQVIKK